MSAGMRSRTPDRLCAEAVELARDAAVEAARPQPIGAYLGAVAEGDRLVTHLFESQDPGYRGWRWSVTVARASRAKNVTVDEVALTPGPSSLLAPDWVPWSERLRPGDLGPGDLLPSEPDDPRLEPGYVPDAVEEEATGPVTAPAEAGEPAADEAGPEAAAVTGADAAGAVPDRATIAAVAGELGLTRPRVLSRLGLSEAAERWEEQYGPRTPMAQSAPASCVTCGFLVPVAGSLRRSFGVCGNEFSPADGHVVALDYGCGAHSEAARVPTPPPPPQPVIDHVSPDPL
ncbi:DUF3027 domain-containing protein [Streptomyces cheonanensis]|uniref:DUF3027 domain-containing protein n=5 Tax=Streptomyces TaxID=1883 RepID=A0A1I6NYQ1_9ACTN|nr:Protein of unknown function [Streptomyces harbinensis]